MPDATRAAPRENTERAHPTDRPTAARAHLGHAPQRPDRTPTPQPRRLRRPLIPHQPSSCVALPIGALLAAATAVNRVRRQVVDCLTALGADARRDRWC